jgi:hypothetical protein
MQYLQCLPTMETLEFSVARLFPHLSNVEKVIVGGIVPQELLDSITAITSNQLRSLRLRVGESRGHFRRRDRKNQWGHTSLRWDSLSRIRWLRILEIRHLKHGEGESLSRALKDLCILKRLVVATSNPRPSMEHIGEIEETSPFNELFDYVFPDKQDATNSTSLEYEAKHGLPFTLESLVLIDSGYEGCVVTNETLESQVTLMVSGMMRVSLASPRRGLDGHTQGW